MPPLKTKPNEQNPKYLPIIDADAKLNFYRCPHCGYRNTVPFGQAYSTVKCQDCGKYLSNKPERPKASTLNKGKLAVQLVLFVIIAVFAKYAIDNTHFVSKTAVAVSELTDEPQLAPTSDNDALTEAEKPNEHEPPPPAPRKEEPEPLAPSEEAEPPAEPPPPDDLGTKMQRPPPPVNGEPPAPPRMAITACQDKRKGMSCLSGHGTCYPIRGELACIPLDHPPPPN